MKYVVAYTTRYLVLELDHHGIYREFATVQSHDGAKKLAAALNATEEKAA